MRLLLRSTRTAPLLFGIALVLTGCDEEPAVTAAATPSKAVSVVMIASRAIEGGLIASGSLMPREDTAVFSDLNGYRVAEVLVEEGVWVKGGQPLARLDDTLLRSQLDQQAALATSCRCRPSGRRRRRRGYKDFDGTSVFAQEQIDARRFAAKAARAQADAQAASARDLRTREETNDDPRALRRADHRTQRARRGHGRRRQSMVPHRQGRPDRALRRCFRKRIGPTEVGSVARVILADGTEVDGTVRLVSPRVDANTKLGKVRIELPVTESIRAGGFARASFTGVSVATIAVPETAILYDADGAGVMLVGADNTISREAIVTGQRGGGYVELVSGPPVGSRVVAKAAAMLVTGDKIVPVETSQPVAPPQ